METDRLFTTERTTPMYDYHVHTRFSADSSLPMEEAILAAVERGVREIAFTEAVSDLHLSALFAVGFGLFALTLLVNVAARVLVWRVAWGPVGGE